MDLTEDEHSLSLSSGENKLLLHQGDIRQLKADAIVCPVNRNLDLTSGIARVLAQAAGNSVAKHRPNYAEPFGKVVVLPGGDLHCKYLFLTVLLGDKEQQQMELHISQAVDRAIRYAEFLRLKSIALPVLGCPSNKWPYPFVAHAMLEVVARYFRRRTTKLKAVLFSAYNQEAFDALRKEAKYFSDR